VVSNHTPKNGLPVHVSTYANNTKTRNTTPKNRFNFLPCSGVCLWHSCHTLQAYNSQRLVVPQRKNFSFRPFPPMLAISYLFTFPLSGGVSVSYVSVRVWLTRPWLPLYIRTKTFIWDSCKRYRYRHFRGMYGKTFQR
jgi:hypothetical protein